MKKKYLKTVEDVLALKDTDMKIYAECEGGYYQFIDGVLCAFDNDDDGWSISPMLNDQEELYILEEESEATEEDVGKMCKFWDTEEDEKEENVGILLNVACETIPYTRKGGGIYCHCRRLSPSEVAEITGYKVEEK